MCVLLREGALYYGGPGSREENAGRCVPLDDITDIYVGKQVCRRFASSPFSKRVLVCRARFSSLKLRVQPQPIIASPLLPSTVARALFVV